ncbi:PRC-barrel domain-containing protein [Undibacterium terreum]|uniref:PRC-barrel domain-containing protein n=1 Tax=Undibacterium terreum TaxID=1224302 RepID=A0A916V1E0_9BURK|nr:PRC-barrel domain-containing protein [Undibacterium terreum]GGD02099.1 hypothetical protein GCM10011396_57040 [Undibacterium terreum]
MKRLILAAFTGTIIMVSTIAEAQIVGSTSVGVAVVELREDALGWSAKHQVLGKPVFNAKNEKIGKIDDIVIAPDKAVSFAIVGAGGFLGVDKHDVAIPVSELKQDKGNFVIDGGTKEALKAMPRFIYSVDLH